MKERIIQRYPPKIRKRRTHAAFSIRLLAFYIILIQSEAEQEEKTFPTFKKYIILLKLFKAIEY